MFRASIARATSEKRFSVEDVKNSLADRSDTGGAGSPSSALVTDDENDPDFAAAAAGDASAKRRLSFRSVSRKVMSTLSISRKLGTDRIDLSNVTAKESRRIFEETLSTLIETPAGNTFDLKSVNKLAEVMIAVEFNKKHAAQKSQNFEFLYHGILLKEYLFKHDFKFKPSELLEIATGHLLIWLRLGLAAEIVHLERARKFFEMYFKKIANADVTVDAENWLNYCKVLLFLGDNTKAASVVKTILTTYENDPQLPSYLFYAGAIHKSLELYDQASNYFFEATQIGPPKLFSNIEMMIIISRNLEKMSDPEASDDEAYKMVYDHLLMDGHLSEEVEYDDWISDSSTWLQLGDKCTVHRMFTLATDFYGLCIMNDPNVFHKPVIWYRFAKACYRCGRIQDAQLSVKQALTRNPFNLQLLRADKFLNQSTARFENLLSEKDLRLLLEQLPKYEEEKVFACTRIQAIARGVLARKHVRLGMGNRKDINQRMCARIGVLLRGFYPVLVSVRPNWMGNIASLQIYDVTSDIQTKVSLAHPFAPMKEARAPRRLALSVCVIAQRSTLMDVLERERRDAKESGVDMSDDVSLLGEGEGEGEGVVAVEKRGMRHQTEDCVVLEFRFTDTQTGEFIARRIALGFVTEVGEIGLLHTATEENKAGQTAEEIQSNLPIYPIDVTPEDDLGSLIENSSYVSDTGSLSLRKMFDAILPSKQSSKNRTNVHFFVLDDPELDASAKDPISPSSRRLLRLREGLLSKSASRSRDYMSPSMRFGTPTSLKGGNPLFSRDGSAAAATAVVVVAQKSLVFTPKLSPTKPTTSSSSSSSSPSSSFFAPAAHPSKEAGEVGERGREEEEDREVIVVMTNVARAEVLRGGFVFKHEHFLLRVLNDIDVTQVTIFHARSDTMFVFLLGREHFDRAQNSSQIYGFLMRILENSPILCPLLLAATAKPPPVVFPANISSTEVVQEEIEAQKEGEMVMIEDNKDSDSVKYRPAAGAGLTVDVSVSDFDELAATDSLIPKVIEKIADLPNPSDVLGRSCFVTLFPKLNGATVALFDPTNRPMIGSGLEILPETEENGMNNAESVGGNVENGQKDDGRMSEKSSKTLMLSSSRDFRDASTDEFLLTGLLALTRPATALLYATLSEDEEEKDVENEVEKEVEAEAETEVKTEGMNEVEEEETRAETSEGARDLAEELKDESNRAADVNSATGDERGEKAEKEEDRENKGVVAAQTTPDEAFCATYVDTHISLPEEVDEEKVEEPVRESRQDDSNVTQTESIPVDGKHELADELNLTAVGPAGDSSQLVERQNKQKQSGGAEEEPSEIAAHDEDLSEEGIQEQDQELTEQVVHMVTEKVVDGVMDTVFVSATAEEVQAAEERRIAEAEVLRAQREKEEREEREEREQKEKEANEKRERREKREREEWERKEREEKEEAEREEREESERLERLETEREEQEEKERLARAEALALSVAAAAATAAAREAEVKEEEEEKAREKEEERARVEEARLMAVSAEERKVSGEEGVCGSYPSWSPLPADAMAELTVSARDDKQIDEHEHEHKQDQEARNEEEEEEGEGQVEEETAALTVPEPVAAAPPVHSVRPANPALRTPSEVLRLDPLGSRGDYPHVKIKSRQNQAKRTPLLFSQDTLVKRQPASYQSNYYVTHNHHEHHSFPPEFGLSGPRSGTNSPVLYDSVGHSYPHGLEDDVSSLQSTGSQGSLVQQQQGGRDGKDGRAKYMELGLGSVSNSSTRSSSPTEVAYKKVLGGVGGIEFIRTAREQYNPAFAYSSAEHLKAALREYASPRIAKSSSSGSGIGSVSASPNRAAAVAKASAAGLAATYPHAAAALSGDFGGGGSVSSKSGLINVNAALVMSRSHQPSFSPSPSSSPIPLSPMMLRAHQYSTSPHSLGLHARGGAVGAAGDEGSVYSSGDSSRSGASPSHRLRPSTLIISPDAQSTHSSMTRASKKPKQRVPAPGAAQFVDHRKVFDRLYENDVPSKVGNRTHPLLKSASLPSHRFSETLQVDRLHLAQMVEEENSFAYEQALLKQAADIYGDSNDPALLNYHVYRGESTSTAIGSGVGGTRTSSPAGPPMSPLSVHSNSEHPDYSSSPGIAYSSSQQRHPHPHAHPHSVSGGGRHSTGTLKSKTTTKMGKKRTKHQGMAGGSSVASLDSGMSGLSSTSTYTSKVVRGKVAHGHALENTTKTDFSHILGDDMDTADHKNQLFKQSVQEVFRKGYYDGQPLPHTTHWERRIADFCKGIGSANVLKKKIYILLSAAPVDLSPEEAVATLAGTAGSIGVALEKFKHLEFLSEIKLVCYSVPVAGIVREQLEGGAQALADVEATMMKSRIGASAGGARGSQGGGIHPEKKSQRGVDLFENSVYDNISGGDGDARRLEQQRAVLFDAGHSQHHHYHHKQQEEGTEVDGEGIEGMKPTAARAPRSLSLFRVNNFEAPFNLPHLNLRVGNAMVNKRGMFVEVPRNAPMLKNSPRSLKAMPLSELLKSQRNTLRSSGELDGKSQKSGRSASAKSMKSTKTARSDFKSGRKAGDTRADLLSKIPNIVYLESGSADSTDTVCGGAADGASHSQSIRFSEENLNFGQNSRDDDDMSSISGGEGEEEEDLESVDKKRNFSMHRSYTTVDMGESMDKPLLHRGRSSGAVSDGSLLSASDLFVDEKLGGVGGGGEDEKSVTSKQSKQSVRLSRRVKELMDQHATEVGGVVVINRRQAIRADIESVLLRSGLSSIRNPIQEKLARYTGGGTRRAAVSTVRYEGGDAYDGEEREEGREGVSVGGSYGASAYTGAGSMSGVIEENRNNGSLSSLLGDFEKGEREEGNGAVAAGVQQYGREIGAGAVAGAGAQRGDVGGGVRPPPHVMSAAFPKDVYQSNDFGDFVEERVTTTPSPPAAALQFQQ